MQNEGFEKIDGYQITKELGEGGYGRVYEGIKDEQIVAIKTSYKYKPDKKNNFQHEYDICKQLDHKNIIKMIEYNRCKKLIPDVLVMKLCKNGSLREYMKKLQNNLDECKRYYQQILEVLEYLQENNICHLDTKPDNILLDKEKKIILTDFGVAKQSQNCNIVTFIILFEE